MTPTTTPTATEVATAVTHMARQESGRVLALLARRFGDLDVADEAVQEALIEATQTWPDRGIPNNPGGWLMTVARRKAIDRVRREESARRRTLAAAPELTTTSSDPSGTESGGSDVLPLIRDEGIVHDEHLSLVLLCCHPALDIDTQVALTLRLVGGLTTDEIARAFLVPETTMAQRLVRAKRKIRDAAIPLSIPRELDDRVDALLAVLYLIFNEGYLATGSGDEPIRVDLANEAVRLTALTTELLHDNPEAEALLALELFHLSRATTRTDATGALVLLGDQDRSAWDLSMINRANTVLHLAVSRMRPGVYQLQAMIASHHANARTAADTDWTTIVGLYRQLLAVTRSPVVALNHAVAVSMADGPHAGLSLINHLDETDDLGRYHLFHSSRGELLLQSGDHANALVAFRSALDLAVNPAERRHLEGRITEVEAQRRRGAGESDDTIRP